MNIQHDWTAQHIDNYEVEYYRVDGPIRSRKHNRTYSEFTPTFTFLWNYDYYCDDVLKSERFEDLANDIILYKEFKYDVATECNLHNSNYYFQVYPNPTSDLLNLNSNIFSAQNNLVNIYTADGRFLRSAKVDFRTEKMTLNLSDLSNGIYFIEVRNEGGRLMEKMVISK